jgi:hypothetical protein
MRCTLFRVAVLFFLDPNGGRSKERSDKLNNMIKEMDNSLKAIN